MLRQRVLTELVPSHTVANRDFSYARPFPGGLCLILSIVHAISRDIFYFSPEDAREPVTRADNPRSRSC